MGTIDSSAFDAHDQRVYAWLQANLGTVQGFQRQARWRPAWEVDIQTQSGLESMIIKGQRSASYVGPMTLRQEIEVHRILERHGVPAPRIRGVIEEPLAMVMERLPGQISLRTAVSDEARAAIREDYVQALVKLHSIDIEEFRAVGLTIPETPRDTTLNLYSLCESLYRKKKRKPFAVVEFVCEWVRRNVPAHHQRRALVTGDSGQFLFDGNRLSGLIDFELAYIGNPITEFAGMRIRDPSEPIDNIDGLIERYAELTGDRADKFSLEYHTAAFANCTPLLMASFAQDPGPEDDYLTYLSFCLGTSRWTMTSIASAIGIELPAVADPLDRPLNYGGGYARLFQGIATMSEAGPEDAPGFSRQRMECLGLYLDRWNRYGPDIVAADLDGASDLLGKRQTDSESAEWALEAFIPQASPDHDERFVRYFHGWLERRNFLLRGCGPSAMLVDQKMQPVKGLSRA
ncbi:MAG: hypothetical protein JWQ90_3828 [Hydrocarboniphaga sp.]|uniref:phosphotransferase n=1 Tax=Hydrocarboniphaga sp. TaxID=2033016 RepID=UPI002612822B|nr:phosphotransferase [Hydrocarboniphaga sp.]MDB5971378.1 hypothetical protein [Hydrocarboniphaga sp.]